MEIFRNLRAGIGTISTRNLKSVSVRMRWFVVSWCISDRDSVLDSSAIKANLTERLRASDDELSSVSGERDLLKANLTETTKELERLHTLSKQSECFPVWVLHSCSLTTTTATTPWFRDAYISLLVLQTCGQFALPPIIFIHEFIYICSSFHPEILLLLLSISIKLIKIVLMWHCLHDKGQILFYAWKTFTSFWDALML